MPIFRLPPPEGAACPPAAFLGTPVTISSITLDFEEHQAFCLVGGVDVRPPQHLLITLELHLLFEQGIAINITAGFRVCADVTTTADGMIYGKPIRHREDSTAGWRRVRLHGPDGAVNRNLEGRS